MNTDDELAMLIICACSSPKCINKTSLHEFILAYNKLSKGLCVFGMLSKERTPSSIIIPELRVLPSTGERGPSSAFSPDPECSPKMLLIAGQQPKRG